MLVSTMGCRLARMPPCLDSRPCAACRLSLFYSCFSKESCSIDASIRCYHTPVSINTRSFLVLVDLLLCSKSGPYFSCNMEHILRAQNNLGNFLFTFNFFPISFKLSVIYSLAPLGFSTVRGHHKLRFSGTGSWC